MAIEIRCFTWAFTLAFGILLHLSFRNSENLFLRRYAAILAILVGIFYGITDEFHQSFVPGRSSNQWDLLADGIGIVIAQAGIILLTIKHLWDRKNRKKKDQILNKKKEMRHFKA